MWSTTWSAPAARTASALRGLAVATTCTPMRFANWIAYLPTTPPAPTISSRCPASRRPSSASACHAVSATDGSAAASVNGMLVGADTRDVAGATTNSAAPPSRSIGRNATTASPTASPVTPSPMASTVPETSYPGTCGSSTGIGRNPPRMPLSAAL